MKIRDGSRLAKLRMAQKSDKTARFSASFAAPFLSDKEKREYNYFKNRASDFCSVKINFKPFFKTVFAQRSPIWQNSEF
ncbi:MAG: hypothetical protein IJX55_00055 [Clostridia bacterium]|nr:hypothetical protein [Clostridia bacterium]